MINLTKQELIELKQSIASLDVVLFKLDLIGAGIAAVHVDAALNQLKSNLMTATEHNNLVIGQSVHCPSEFPLITR